MRARMDHEGVKMRKFISEGEDWRQWVDHHEETADMLDYVLE